MSSTTRQYGNQGRVVLHEVPESQELSQFWILKQDIVGGIHRESCWGGNMRHVLDNLYLISILPQVPLSEHIHDRRNLWLIWIRGSGGVLFSSTSWRWPAWVRSATVLEKKFMNSPTEERWKKPNVERSWAEASWTAGWTSLRRMAMEKRRILSARIGVNVGVGCEGGWAWRFYVWLDFHLRIAFLQNQSCDISHNHQDELKNVTHPSQSHASCIIVFKKKSIEF